MAVVVGSGIYPGIEGSNWAVVEFRNENQMDDKGRTHVEEVESGTVHFNQYFAGSKSGLRGFSQRKVGGMRMLFDDVALHIVKHVQVSWSGVSIDRAK